ncbi:hypothetical protein DL93DRAFT_2232851 [Clavulina sp. PMI_390]|nr:hypothetical protein DL93DRAFT_2232851 [Clavulina sp. PMI_390]
MVHSLRHVSIQARQASIPGGPAGRGIPISPNLEDIEICFEYMHFERFREILQNARSLKSLAIYGMAALSERGRPDVDWQESYVLSHLRSLKLPLYPSECVQMLLKTATCPVLHNLHLQGVSQPGSTFYEYATFSEHMRSFLQHAPELEGMTLSWCKVAELALFTTPLRTHGLQLQRLSFWASPVEETPSFLPHLVETIQARRVAGAHILELKTDESIVSVIREALLGVPIISSLDEG